MPLYFITTAFTDLLAGPKMNQTYIPRTLLTLLLFLSIFFLSACGGSNAPAPSGPVLTEIHISPNQISIANNSSLQLQVLAIYSDNSTNDITDQISWSAQNNSIATVTNTGLITAASLGSTIITASFQDRNAAASLTVSAATLDLIEVSPSTTTIAKGTTSSLGAIGVFSDLTSQDLTSQVNWLSSDVSIVDVTSSGQINAINNGSATITASLNSKTSSASVTVTAATLTSLSVIPGSASIALGSEYQFTVSGSFSDGSIQDLTQQVSWSVTDNSVIDSVTGTAGLIQGKAVGSTTLSASFGTLSSTVLVNVTSAVIDKLEISSTSTNVALGSNLQLQATAIFSDDTSQLVTTQANWLTSDQDIASIDSQGLITSHNTGSVTITSIHNNISSTLAITVSSAMLTSIEITPLTQSLPTGISQPFTATGIYSDNSVQDITNLVTWSSTDTNVATIDNSTENKALLTAIGSGPTSISASLGLVSDIKSLTVTNAILTSINISPGSAIISNGLSLTYKAIGQFSDGSLNDVTNQASWSTSDASIASGNTNQPFVIQSHKSGGVTVSAKLNDIYAFTSLTINSATLTSITIDQTDITIAKGTIFKFTASGHYSDSSTQDLSDHVIWESSIPNNASINNDIINKGLASGINEGISTIKASFNSIESSTTLTVSPATLSSIDLNSITSQLPPGQTIKITATGTYSDSTTQNITNDVTWISNANNLAPISNAVFNKGEVIGYAPGDVTITAILNGTLSSALVLTVLPVDQNAPLSLSTKASPNVILNDNADSTIITAIVQPSGSAGVISNLTLVDYIITDINGTSTVTVNTISGVATHTLVSSDLGFISVKAQIQGTDISSTSNIFSTDSFHNVLLRSAYINPIYSNGIFLPGSAFGLITKNLSNRDLNISQFQVLNGGTHLKDSPVTGGSTINNGLLNAGETFFVLYTLDADTVNLGINIGILFSETVTGSAFGFSYNVTYTP